MILKLQDDLPRSQFPLEFLNPQFVIILNEICSIICKCDDTAKDPKNRQLDDVHFCIFKDMEFDTYEISFVFHFSNDLGTTTLFGDIERKFGNFKDMLKTLKLLSVNMREIEASGTMSSSERAAMILQNFSYYLETNILLNDCSSGVNTYILTTKNTEEEKPNIPEWVKTYFDVNFTGFGYGYDEEDLKNRTFKERFSNFIINPVSFD